MLRLSELRLPLDALNADGVPPAALLRHEAARRLGLPLAAVASVRLHKRSFDARGAQVQAVCIVDVALAAPDEEERLLAHCAADTRAHVQRAPEMCWQPPLTAPPGAPRPIVIGFGPCGIFAALTLAQCGLRPIVLERGRSVRERTQDTWALWRRGQFSPESNVQFGEGGAGTFSDGKLFSQVRDPRHLGRRVLEEFVAAGAPASILVDAHPHIGTFRLVKMVQNLRARIQELGGEVHFRQRVDALIVEGTRVRGVCTLDGASGQTREWRSDAVIAALGHSARDTFAMLHGAGVAMQAKPFSIGVRIEHPQRLIDRAMWGRHAGHPLLGAAEYRLVHHANSGRAVYSFCMCPGGTVVAATSEAGGVVTNGMSQYSRAARNANAALAVSVDARDWPRRAADIAAQLGISEEAARTSEGEVHPLAAIALQRQLEHAAFALGGGGYLAPAQRLGDFLARRASSAMGSVVPSYQPGVTPADLHAILPPWAAEALHEAIPAFARRIKGYDMADAVLTGLETRTSSPLRLLRGADGQSVNTAGLWPAGEGAGYAGGILSAAIDGIHAAEAVARAMAAHPSIP